MNASKKEPIYWCRPGLDGQDKKNPMALKQKAIGPSGQVVEISMATGKTITSYLGNTYAQIIQMEKKRRNWVWYVDCTKEKNKCYAGPLETRKSSAKFCAHCSARELMITTRTENRNSSSVRYNSQFESRMDKLARAIEAATVSNVRPTLTDAQLAAAMAAPAEDEKPKSQTRPPGV